MSAFWSALNPLAVVWCERVWAVVWQSTILVAVVALIAALVLRRSSPSVRYWVWQIVALKILLMPFWTYALPLPRFLPAAPEETAPVSRPLLASRDGVPAETGDLLSSDSGSVTTPSPPAEQAQMASSSGATLAWQTWLLLGWGTVVLAQVARLVQQRRRLLRVLRQSTPADGRLTEVVGETAGRLALARTPRAVVTETDCSPFVCGIQQPVVVLPRTLAASLNPTELRHVLLHELAHVQRRDLVWGWIGEIARVVYFFHPLVHWVAYQTRLERELACDAMAMSLSGQNAGEYAATLVRVVSQASEPTVFRTAAASAGLDGGAK